ncbi:MAG TPA: RNA polymerase sigma factor [Hyphomonadaceae bacterium]|jgi:RNA polymerase sigma-70 factor (ECF subfamily)|nr:RNA polymerase sigma factor [Hyphomonadaceae bacterium]
MAIRGPPQHTRRLALLSDEQLVGLAAGGDRAAYGELARRHARFVRDLMRRMGADQATADDLTQDAFIDAMRSLPGYRLDAPFTAWIRTVAARLYLKRKQKDARLVVMAEPVGEDQAAESMDPAVRMDLNAALATLSPAERTCVTLCHGAGLTGQEIADALDVPLGTVKSHVTRGLDKLRWKLKVHGEGSR